jgi:hypothetical protein
MVAAITDADRRFAGLQARLRELGRGDPLEAEGGTVVSLPSLDVDPHQLARHRRVLSSYEERALWQLLLLRRRDVRMVFVLSEPVQEVVLRSYLDLVPELDAAEARRRVTTISADDPSPRPLGAKVLARPEILDRIRAAVGDTARAFLLPYAVTATERDLALELDLPLYGTPPEAAAWGTKSGARRLFAQEGVPHPAGAAALRDVADVMDAVGTLRAADPVLERVVVKLDVGLHGEGNRVLRVGDLPRAPARAARAALARRVATLGDAFLQQLCEDGGVVEELITAAELRSPSVQLRLCPDGRFCEPATHEQLLGGRDGQTFVGCRFPADRAYARALVAHAETVARRLAATGALGRFGVDFVAARGPGGGWRLSALEINLREGGTTHPFGTLRLLTDGGYDARRGTFTTAAGEERCYRASDDLADPAWVGIEPERLLAAATRAGLRYDPARRVGTVFHLLRSLPGEGHLGMTVIGPSPAETDALYERATALLGELAVRRSA